MASSVELATRAAATRLIPPDVPTLVAVSGGGDSVALLHLLHRVLHHGRNRLVVAHLDHALRRGSRADRRFVESLAAQLCLTCVAERCDVAELRRRGESPEEAARRIRRAFLMRVAGEHGCERIAVGHTLDDQAETILLRLVRGAGSTALGGMAEQGPGPFVRPLLALERQALRRYLARRKLSFRDDPSNLLLRFDRNRVRRLVLPLLTRTLNPRAAEHLVGAAGRLREDACFLDQLAARRFEELSRCDGRGRLHLAAREFGDSAPVLAKRIARLALQAGGADPRRIATRHIEALVRLARPGSGRELHLPSGLLARRGRSEIVLGKP